MHDDEKNDFLNRTDGVPSLITVRDTLDECHAAGIVEDELCCFRVDTVLRLVDLVFRRIPFDLYSYLQYSTYTLVKANRMSALHKTDARSPLALPPQAGRYGMVTLE